MSQPLSVDVQVWQYTAAMAHFRNCLEVAAGAAAEKRRYTLAITYDELCRKHWSQKAARGDRDFNVNTASFVKDKDMLERARALFDANANAKGSHLCGPLSRTLFRFAFARQISEAHCQVGKRKASSSQTVGLHRRSAAAIILQYFDMCIMFLCPSASKKLGKNSWAKGHGKTKGYHSGSSWNKKSYGSSW